MIEKVDEEVSRWVGRPGGIIIFQCICKITIGRYDNLKLV